MTVGDNNILTAKGYILVDGTLNVEGSGYIVNIERISKSDGTPYTGFALNKNSENIYEISSAFDLARLSYSVNVIGNEFVGETVRLLKDIDMDNKIFTPIGNFSYAFRGEFDGNGKTVSNLKVVNIQLAGLFGFAYNAYIHDLTLQEVDIQGKNYVGVVVAVAYNGIVLENINASGTATGSSYYGPGLVGFIADGGEAVGAYFINCNTSTTIHGVYNIGGMFGTATGYESNIYIVNCTNSGDINASIVNAGQLFGFGNGTSGNIYYDTFTAEGTVVVNNNQTDVLHGANAQNIAEKEITVSGDFNWNSGNSFWNVSAQIAEKA